MSAICGFAGPAGDESAIEAMLTAVPWRGDVRTREVGEGFGLGTRHHGVPGVPEEEPQIRFEPPRRLVLRRDAFGAGPLHYVVHRQTLWFASELKQLLAVPGLPVEVDPVAIHRYLSFSFVPGEAMPVRGMKALLPGHELSWDGERVETRRWFHLEGEHDPALAEPEAAASLVRALGERAVAARLPEQGPVGLYLSGGLDSSLVGAWLVGLGADVRAFSLDFGEQSVELEEARAVARHLGIPLQLVPCGPAQVAEILDTLVDRLDLPFGDPVTGPQLLLGRAARQAGLRVVFNGEGGDQLFGGWTARPMVAATLYGGLFGEEPPEEQYLLSWHRFYGLEDLLYTRDLAGQTLGRGQRRALLQETLRPQPGAHLLDRVRRTDIQLKGGQSILPRAERIASGYGLSMRAPLFDRALAELSFRLPPTMKLQGSCEKYVLKLAARGLLPEAVVWRRKSGMCAPVTDWLLQPGPLRDRVQDALGDASLRRRGWFQPAYVSELLEGRDIASEPRRRRVGERLWTLLMVELWLRRFIDRSAR